MMRISWKISMSQDKKTHPVYQSIYMIDAIQLLSEYKNNFVVGRIKNDLFC